MARNKYEQINYLLKVRRGKHGGMSDVDYRQQLQFLFELGFEEGRTYQAIQQFLNE